MENGDLQWNYQLKIVIFHSYVSLPEGITPLNPGSGSCKPTSQRKSWRRSPLEVEAPPGCAGVIWL